jgi:hypothetical protein
VQITHFIHIIQVLTLTDEKRPWVLKKRELRKMLGIKGVEKTGDWRKLRDEELNDFTALQIFG